jgi:flagellar FliL protein
MAEPVATPETETPAESAPAAAPARKLTLPLIVIAGLIIGGAAGALVLGPRIARARSSKGAANATAAADSLKGGDQKGAASETPVHVIDNLVLNPAGSGGTRFLLASVGLQTASAAADELIKKREVEARDVVLAVLGAKHVEDLAEIGNRERIKLELKTALDSLFGPGVVRRVYFPQFVIQ